MNRLKRNNKEVIRIIEKYQDKEWLEKQYIKKKLSTNQMGKLCKVNGVTIGRQLKKYNIPIRSNSERHLGQIAWNMVWNNIGKKWLYNKYIEEKLSMQKIAKLCGVTFPTIYRCLKRFNIPVRSNSKSHIGQIPWNKGIPRSKETLEKMSGENASNWKGGITPLTQSIRTRLKYRQWRSDIFTRDNFTCQNCRQIGGKLNAHHIKSLSSILQKYEIITLEEALDCEELWNINNGITLCEECHKLTDNYCNGNIKRR